MPARDGRGPLGEGPFTGRGMGNCATSNEGDAGVRPMGFGRSGRARGMGTGICMRPRKRFFRAGYTSDIGEYAIDEKARLETLIKRMESDVSSMKERLKNLTNKEEK